MVSRELTNHGAKVIVDLSLILALLLSEWVIAA